MAWPLMKNNVAREDLDAVIDFLRDGDPILTQSTQVRAFEEEWSAWLGCRHSVFVNSGASANLLTLTTLRETFGLGEIIVPTLTWVSDIASVLQCGFTPVFVDIDPSTLGMNPSQVLKAITPRTRAVFLTHVLGFCALTAELLKGLEAAGVPLIEDVCESHGATFQGRKLGSLGLMSNFSFYYAHHMTTIEGGMISTDDEDLFQKLRMLRSHGMVREATSEALKGKYAANFPDLNPDFIFAYPAYNLRSTEINAVMGRSQLRRLDANNEKRRANFNAFLQGLDPETYRTDFTCEGSCNYAFTLILRRPDEAFRERVERALRERGIEFRRGTAGGGNQLRQPYLRQRFPHLDPAAFPEVDHVHFFGYYIGNHPGLEGADIQALCELLNGL